MRRIAVLLIPVVTAFAQVVSRISPDDAAKHLIKGPQPRYPELAEAASIQGNVILQIRIGESGTVSVLRLVQGHPMLAPAAIEAVKSLEVSAIRDRWQGRAGQHCRYGHFRKSGESRRRGPL
jgi:TonB family protein